MNESKPPLTNSFSSNNHPPHVLLVPNQLTTPNITNSQNQSEREIITKKKKKKRGSAMVAAEESHPHAMTTEPKKVGGEAKQEVGGEIVHRQPSTHPLEHSWTFWFDNPSAKSKQTTWGSSIRPIHTFCNAEDFWCLYNNIHHPSKLAVGADFYCFKHKIQPKWEDPVCANGGKWTISFPRGKSDTPWLYTLLAMIGEQFDHGDDICGAVVNVRAKQEKISLWTKNASKETAQMSIGKQWKEFLDYNDNIGFIFHEDAKKHDRFAKNRYST